MSDTKVETWQEKQARATALIEDVKALNAKGITDENTATKAHQMVADASAIMAEVKAEKLAEDQKRLDEILSKAEGQIVDSAKAAPTTSSPIVPIQTIDHSEKAVSEFFAGKDRIESSEKAAVALGIKALSEGTASAGGYLVPPTYMQDLFAETRRQGNALRDLGWLNVHPVTGNQVLLPTGSGTASVGWTAENVTKPTADQTYGQVTVNIYTLAGISKLSKQLVDDSSPTAADLVTRELGSLIGNAEEAAIISGSGSAQPRGILNTTGINSTVYTDASPTGQETIDAILDAIVQVQTNYFDSPNGILMAPRRLAALQKTKDSAGNYLFNLAGSTRAPGTGGGAVGTVAGELLGYPLAISTNVPTNLGTGTNEDRIIVGNWNEAHWFQRQDITLDVSDTAGTAFTDNQVWFRMEERAGFSAERYPKAFAVVSGTGLAV